MLIATLTSSPSKGANPKVRILTLGSYPPTLKTWHVLLEAQGYQAVVCREKWLWRSEKWVWRPIQANAVRCHYSRAVRR